MYFYKTDVMGYNVNMNIGFIPSNKEIAHTVPMPKSAKLYIPEWYKDIKLDKEIKFNNNSEPTNINIKSCMPFLDSLSQGYIQETWADLYIKVKDGVIYTQSTGAELMMMRPSVSLELSNTLAPYEFAWKMQWIPKMPEGWSVMITHPLNRFDLPFQTVSGVIDSDKFYHTASGNVPFYMADGFEGVIPAGTPMYQIIPIRREFWDSYTIPYSDEDQLKRTAIIRRNFLGVYKKMFWNKKLFS